MLMNPELIKFANGNTDFYEAAVTCFADNDMSSEKKNLTHTAFLAEVEHKAGISREGNDINAWIAHPSVGWAAMSIVNATIRAIVPVTILPDFDIFSEMRTVGYGDLVKFTVEPRSFFLTSLGGKGERNTFRVRKFAQDIELHPVQHMITVYRNMYNVLAGKTNIVDFLSWVLLSIRTDMYTQALGVLNDGLTSIPVGSLNVNGAFDMKTLVKMCETVEFRNGGVKPVIAGSATALMNVLPDSTSGYRMNVDGEGNGKIDLIRNIMGYSVLKLGNAVTKAGNLILPDNKLYVISPSQDKLVKGVMVNQLSNSNDFYANADLTQDYTFRLEYNFAYASSAFAGTYTIA